MGGSKVRGEPMKVWPSVESVPAQLTHFTLLLCAYRLLVHSGAIAENHRAYKELLFLTVLVV